jgi:hypothetical protein
LLFLILETGMASGITDSEKPMINLAEYLVADLLDETS